MSNGTNQKDQESRPGSNPGCSVIPLGKEINLKFPATVDPCGAGPGKLGNSNNDQLIVLGSKMEEEDGKMILLDISFQIISSK